MAFGPFITSGIHVFHGQRQLWLSRALRKGLHFPGHQLPGAGGDTPLWQTRGYNYAIGIFFAIGSVLFAAASILVLPIGVSDEVNHLANMTYFAGSIPFTIAATLQHLQSANTIIPGPDGVMPARGGLRLIGWAPRNAGWWSTLSQWMGTIAFNVSTFNAITPPDSPGLARLLVWEQNVEGSVLFLISGYLAFIEVSHRFWSWQPGNLSWRVVFVNFAGCVAFMIAALAPASITEPTFMAYLTLGDCYTLLGAICFLAGALLSLPESRHARKA